MTFERNDLVRLRKDVHYVGLNDETCTAREGMLARVVELDVTMLSHANYAEMLRAGSSSPELALLRLETPNPAPYIWVGVNALRSFKFKHVAVHDLVRIIGGKHHNRKGLVLGTQGGSGFCVELANSDPLTAYHESILYVRRDSLRVTHYKGNRNYYKEFPNA